MTEEDVANLFKAASSLGYKYGIPLLGDEAIVGLTGYAEGDYRISDSEHLIHELTHAVLLGIPIEEDLPKKVTEVTRTMPMQAQCFNEIETFSVTMEVMRRSNIEFEVDEYLCQLEVQLAEFEKPRGFNVKRYVLTFQDTERGRTAVEAIMKMLKEEA